MIGRLAILFFLCFPTWALAEEPVKATGPLAGPPSKPGPHVAKIKAMGDDEWLDLGSPAPDPKWGKARGRSWGANMPAAPDLRGAFFFGEGVHGYVKPDGHYMNDLWFYDINAHRWVCLYPGLEVKTVVRRIENKELVVDDDGLMVDRDGQPLPPLLIHAYGNLGYDPDRRKFAFFGGQFGNYFTTGKGGAFEDANRLFQEQRKGKKVAKQSPFFYDIASGKFECFPVDGAPRGGGGFGVETLLYVGGKKQFFFGGVDGVWFLDTAKRTWATVEPKGAPPTGYDNCAAYDSRRDRVYYYKRDGKTPEDNFMVYDVKENTWSTPRPKGAGPAYCSSVESFVNFDSVNDRLVCIRDRTTKDAPGERQGVYAYDPATNTWAEPLPLPPEVAKIDRNASSAFYDPELNAYFCHFAGDSSDNGAIWVYRYKRGR